MSDNVTINITKARNGYVLSWDEYNDDGEETNSETLIVQKGSAEFEAMKTLTNALGVK